MKTITKEIKVYEYKELSENAKEFAFEKWQQSMQNESFFWHEASINSLENFLGFFNIEILDYSLGLNNLNFIKWSKGQIDQSILNLKGSRLIKYINNHVKQQGKYLKCIDKDFTKYYKFKREVKFFKESNKTCTFFYSKIQKEYKGTGYCFDYIFESEIKTLIEKTKKNRSITFEYFIDSCIESFISEYEKDYEFQSSKEIFLEICNENNYLESGEFYL